MTLFVSEIVTPPEHSTRHGCGRTDGLWRAPWSDEMRASRPVACHRAPRSRRIRDRWGASPSNRARASERRITSLTRWTPTDAAVVVDAATYERRDPRPVRDDPLARARVRLARAHAPIRELRVDLHGGLDGHARIRAPRR